MVSPTLNQFVRSNTLLRWLLVTRDEHVVVGQFPNAPIIVAIAGNAVAYFTQGVIHLVAAWIAIIGFLVWSVLEIGWGVNPFRRILGVIVLGLVGRGAIGMMNGPTQ